MNVGLGCGWGVVGEDVEVANNRDFLGKIWPKESFGN